MENYYYNLILKTEVVKYTPEYNGDVIVVNIYSGLANENKQTVHFKEAKENVAALFPNINIVYNEMDVLQFRNNVIEKKWTYKTLVDWLLSSHIHFIICHPHQGLIERGIDIAPLELYNELQRLKFHIGFPSGDELNCPVFTQNKAIYLNALYQYKLCNPTFFINVEDDFYLYSDDLKLFFDNHWELQKRKDNNGGGQDKKTGYILKTPFSYNRRNKVELKDNEHLLENTFCYHDQFKNVQFSSNTTTTQTTTGLPIQRGMPYFMVQPMMSNRREFKIVLFNHRALYISASPTQTLGFAFKKENMEYIFKFSEYALNVCKEKCPHMITDGLIRIDVFENQNNNLIVNEIEGLEAKYDHATKFELTGDLEQKLQMYWTEKLQLFINKYQEGAKFN
jgi:hypothetical protein